MDIIALAREIGHQIQADARYTALRTAQADSDADGDLQELIGEFNLKRLAINNEASKEARDEEKLKTLNSDLRKLYREIMENEKMAVYQTTKREMDHLVQRLTSIITLCAEGEDPATADYDPSSCTGNCGTCGGCH